MVFPFFLLRGWMLRQVIYSRFNFDARLMVTSPLSGVLCVTEDDVIHTLWISVHRHTASTRVTEESQMSPFHTPEGHRGQNKTLHSYSPHTILCSVRNINLFTWSGWFTEECHRTSHESFSSFIPSTAAAADSSVGTMWGGVSRAGSMLPRQYRRRI